MRETQNHDKLPTHRRLFLLALALLAAGLRFVPPESGSGPVEAVLVESASQRSPAIGAVVASPELRAFVAANHMAWHCVDPSDEGPDMAKFQWAFDAAKTKPLPLLAIRRGEKVSVFPLPATPAETIALLQRFAPHLAAAGS